MPGNISAGRLCRRACFEFVSQTSSTHRLKEDLEPLPARPAPHARSCLSAKRVQNSTWEAAAAGGPGGGGSLRPEPVALQGWVPRPRGVEEEIPRESETDQRAQADKRWRPARCRDPHPVAAPGWGAWGRGEFGLSQPPAARPPGRSKQRSKYRPVSLKRRFRTCRPDAAPRPCRGEHSGATSLLSSGWGRGRGCLPQNAGWAEPAGGLVGERELGVRDGTWRTLPVSSGAAWGLQGWAPGARPLKCLVPCGHLARTGSGLLHWVSCPSPLSASGTSWWTFALGNPAPWVCVLTVHLPALWP